MSAQPDYYQGANHRIIDRVPPDALRVLDIGCSAGNLGQILKSERPDREVWGIELVPSVAAQAKAHLDHVLVGNVEEMNPLPLPPTYFDCIICGDVLEHLKEPGLLLKRLHGHLAPGGVLIVNVPNIAHWSVVLQLLQGKFSYEDSGLLDRTHLRFFTPSSLKGILWDAGFRVIGADALQLLDIGISAAIASAAEGLGVDQQAALGTLRTYQQLYVCRSVPSPHEEPEKMKLLLGPHVGSLVEPKKRCSVVVVTYNSMSSIEALLSSLLPTLSRDDELIFVDNASSDGTQHFLDSLQSKKHPLHSKKAPLKLIANTENLGFSRACNQAILESEGRFIVLLNPDTRLSPGWLERLTACLEDPRVAAAGPLSYGVTGDQYFGLHMDGSALRSEDHAAAELAARRKATPGLFTAVATKLLIGFCMALRRDVLNQFGLLEERCFLGADDLEISWRLRTLGFQLIVARDVFVAHEGGQSFANLGPGEKAAKVGESDAALISKLCDYYGPGTLPSSLELWGNPIFDEAMAKFGVQGT